MKKIKHNLIRTDLSGKRLFLAASWDHKPWFIEIMKIVGTDLSRNAQFNDLCDGQRMQFGEWWYSLEESR